MSCNTDICYAHVILPYKNKSYLRHLSLVSYTENFCSEVSIYSKIFASW